MRPVLFAAAALTANSLFSAAGAAPMADQSSIAQATADVAPVEKAQYPYGYYYPYAGPTPYAWGGYNYCWYPRGWRGPGWYWCGYAWRTGLGWGGPWAWGWGHGWGRGWGWRGGWGWHGGWGHGWYR